jgi:AcrR family transcriptional regulator
MTRRRRLTRSERQARTRAEILEAAAQVFAQRGYAGAGMAEIAAEAGYSHGAIYSNFADKEQLFLALYEDWVASRVAELHSQADESGTPVDRTRCLVDGWMDRVKTDPRALLLRLEFTARAASDSELRKKLGLRVGAVPLAIEQLTADGESELDLPPEHVALALQALSLGLALEELANPGAVPQGLGGELATRLLESLSTSHSTS